MRQKTPQQLLRWGFSQQPFSSSRLSSKQSETSAWTSSEGEPVMTAENMDWGHMGQEVTMAVCIKQSQQAFQKSHF